jgi:hypothetical protein
MSNTSSGLSRDELENFLRKRGCQILGRHQKEAVLVRVDGQEHLGELAADYTVRHGKKNYVVWVKREAGDLDPTEPALRRRLIELDRVFGLDGVLIADPAEGSLAEVHFKFPRERGLDFYFQFLSALFIIAAVIGIIWLMVSVRLL